MTNTKIECLKCGEPISLDEAFLAKLRGSVDEKYRVELDRIRVEERTRFEKEIALEKKKITNSANTAKELEVKDLLSQIDEQRNALQMFQSKELELRKEKRLLEEQRHQVILEVERKLDEGKKTIEANAVKKAEEQYRFKIAEHEKQNADMKMKIDELQRKTEQRSQQLQGEVMEIELEKLLRASFPNDEFVEVPKGVSGADVIQKVTANSGQLVGTILWESKRTKNWSDKWIPKIKTDLRNIKGDLAVIVSETLPQDVTSLGHLEQVWIADFSAVVGLAEALRAHLIAVAQTRALSKIEDGQMQAAINFLTGTVFRQQIESLVETYVSQQAALEKEKRAMQTMWAVRASQNELALKSLSGIYGGLQASLGSKLSTIPTLQLEDYSSGYKS